MIQKDIKKKNLEGSVNLNPEESSGRNPLHQKRIELLRVKKTGSHTDFFFKLEQHISLIEFDKLAKEALLTHLFQEQSDETMGLMAQEILVNTPEKDDNQLCQEIKRIESSTWYTGRRNDRARVARFCSDCKSPVFLSTFLIL